jgi:hypothetical protein
MDRHLIGEIAAGIAVVVAVIRTVFWYKGLRTLRDIRDVAREAAARQPQSKWKS